MEISDKIKKYFDKGVEVSKNAFDKGVEVSKSALNKASNAVQDFSDKSVIRIERRQYESKRADAYSALGKLVAEKFIGGAESVYAEDEEVATIVAEVRRFDEEIARRMAADGQDEVSNDNNGTV